MRKIALAFLTATMIIGCDSAEPIEETPREETGPSGVFTINPVFFRLSLVVDPSSGITQDLRGNISGSLNLAVNDGQISGSGSCEWSTRRHTPRTSQTVEESAAGSVSVTGSLNGDDARLVLTGCAWNQKGYRGTWDGETYELTIPADADGPLFESEVWEEGQLLEGDPRSLVLTRP